MAYIFSGGDNGIKLDITEGLIAATTTTTYLYFNMGAEDWHYGTIIFDAVSNNTLTLEGTTNNAKSEDADSTWTDVTTALTGAASATTNGGWILDTPIPFTRMRVKVYSTDTTNTALIDIIRAR